MVTSIQHREEHEGGFALIAALVIVVILAGLAAAMVFSSATHHMASMQAGDRARSLALAEAASAFILLDLDADPLGPVATYTKVGNTYQRRYTPFETGDGQALVELAYTLDDGTPVTFSDPPVELYDRLRVRVTGFRPRAQRTVIIDFDQQFVLFNSALVSDSIPAGGSVYDLDGNPLTPGGSNKNLAKDGHIVFSDKGRADQLWVSGDIISNGGVYFGDGLLETSNANTDINFAGLIANDLAQGEETKIKDYTSIGSQEQLFDFDRFIAAARAGAGLEFTSLEDFADAMNTANAANQFLEGIIVLTVNEDDATKIENKIENKAGRVGIPDGINIRGTLLFNFEAGTDAMHKVFVKTSLNINPADLSGLVANDPDTYVSGYGGAWTDDTKRPHNVDISGDGFENFADRDDMPALMFNTGIVDLHDACNVCGLVYGPSFIEIENKEGNLQYFSGSIMGGAGVYVEGNKTQGNTIIKFDPNTIDMLATAGGKGMGLRIISWRTIG